MEQIDYFAILSGTLIYLITYYLLFKIPFFSNSLTKWMISSSENYNPTDKMNLVFVGIFGFIYCFFINLFMIMSERSGMADGFKTTFLLTIINFCIPLAIYFKINSYSWDKYFRVIFFFLLIQIIVGGFIGYKAFQ
ncbi:MAG: hypothetical protein IT267_06985 [Saprospiraceae bacterium]|nr:hypothetical protein [Saprospiraceae bacterium]